MNKKQDKLNSRQWALYNLLLDVFPNKLTLEEIYDNMRGWYPLVKTSKFNNAVARRMITDDLTAINDTDPVQLIIIRNSSSAGGIGIATSKEEAEEFIKTLEISLLEQLKSVWRQKRKLSNHNQMKAVFNQEKENYRAYIEASEVANG